jgi:hypothetical protein
MCQGWVGSEMGKQRAGLLVGPMATMQGLSMRVRWRLLFSGALLAMLWGAAAVISNAQEEDGFVSMFDGKSLEGWQQINGTATYEVIDGEVVGTTAEGSPNSFLCSEGTYGDFELQFEVFLVDDDLNSGVQFRSLSMADYQDGRVHGYQVEIATNGSAGRIYDEARRGKWLDDQPDDAEEAKKAFKSQKWNRYRVVCEGTKIQTFVNDVPVATVDDDVTAEGFIGLQVHSYDGDKPAKVKWRNIRIKASR